MAIRRAVRRSMERTLAESSIDIERVAHRVRPSFDFVIEANVTPGIVVGSLQMAHLVAERFSDSEILELAGLLCGQPENPSLHASSVHSLDLASLRREMRRAGFRFDRLARKWLVAEPPKPVDTTEVDHAPYDVLVSRKAGLLRFDIVDNTTLTATEPAHAIKEAYSTLYSFAREISSKCGGIVDRWEGDGATVIFPLKPHPAARNATICAMKLLHYVVYSHGIFRRTIGSQMRLRLAVHFGDVYLDSELTEMEGPAFRRVLRLESHSTEPNTVTVSPPAARLLGPKLHRYLTPFDTEGKTMYRHQVTWA